jgi:hypothetical protein
VNKRKLSKSAAVPGVVVGVAWYREADWSRIKGLFPDSDELHDTYAEWLMSAEDSVRALQQRGVDAKRVVIDIDAFIVWGLVRGRRLDASGRAEYTTEKLQAELERQLPGAVLTSALDAP